ncbi:MAG: GtrA family protein [Sphingobium sp.]
MQWLAPLVRRAAGLTYSRYVLASAASLALDIGLFLAALHLGLPAMAASALGYAAGLGAHWLLSTRFVFDDGMAASGTARSRQKGLFVATGLIGLCITTAIVGAGASLGIDPRLAKILAIAISFQATYFARRAAIFRA